MSANYLNMLKRIDKMPIYTDVETLDSYCEYLLNDRNKNITYSNLSNLNDFISMMDPKIMMTSDAKMARYQFLSYYLEARLKKGIVKRELAISYVMDQVEPKYAKIIRREIINSIDPDQLSKKDIEFLNGMIFAQLNVQFMHRYQIGMTKMIEDVNNNEFGKTPEDCENAIQFLQTILSDLTKAQRRSKQENRFNLTDSTHFYAIMQEACERALSNSTKLNTGFVALNSMINGGFENARVYNFIGATGGFKSGLLLNLMKTIKKYNKGREHKDPTKRPTILFLSQENNIWETFERIFGIFTRAGKMQQYDPDKILELLADGGFTVIGDDPNEIDIEFRYYGNMDISVPDIRGIVEELDNEGREVIVVIQDYIERLRPPMLSADKRMQLIDVSNQLHDLAIELDIPIITASQFNRSGVSTIESMRDTNKFDAAKSVGMKDISESFGMLKNFDANISIVIEYDKNEERFYLGFRALKYRGDDSESIGYFLQPFIGKKVKIQLDDDFDMPVPTYRLSMIDENEANAIDEKVKLKKLQARQRGLLEPIDVDPSADEINGFVNQIVGDQERANAQMEELNRTDVLLTRNADGFIILDRKISDDQMELNHYKKLKVTHATYQMISHASDEDQVQQGADFDNIYR